MKLIKEINIFKKKTLMKKEKNNTYTFISDKYPEKKSAIMPVLQHLQKENSNYLDSNARSKAAAITGISMSSVYGISTYYTMFNTKPVGKYHLQLDTCVPGFLHGADAIMEHLCNKLYISDGETTADGMFTLSSVQDLGSSATGPVLQVNDRYFENMTIEKIDALIDALRNGADPVNDPSINVVSHFGILLNDRTNPECRSLAYYIQHGGYSALSKALSMKPEDIIDEVKESGLRGRGGAGFPAGLKWSYLPKDDKRPVYLICNADEGEPGTFKDRQIMEFNPHLLIEGIAISASAVNAEKAFIYIRGEFSWIADILETAINEAKNAGLLSHTEIVVHRGGGSYVCGDETAQIESLEGKRGNPRMKPPFPANSGLYGFPTVINNVETLSCVPFIILKSAAAFRNIGTVNNSGPKLFGISGHVNKPGIFEYPLGTPLNVLINAAGGVKGNLKGVIPGGLSSAIITAGEADGLILDYDSCLKKGTSLGSGAVIVINDFVSIPELALRTIEFYHHESCGQCVPCREGTRIIKNRLGAIVTGRGKMDDIDLILRTCSSIRGLTICPMGEAFTVPIIAMISKFRTEFDDLIKC